MKMMNESYRFIEVQNTVQPSCPPEDQSAIDIPTTVSQGDPVTQQPISILEDEGTLPPRHVEYTGIKTNKHSSKHTQYTPSNNPK